MAVLAELEPQMADSKADAGDVLSAEADDHFHDECGVFGIFGRQDAAH